MQQDIDYLNIKNDSNKFEQSWRKIFKTSKINVNNGK